MIRSFGPSAVKRAVLAVLVALGAAVGCLEGGARNYGNFAQPNQALTLAEIDQIMVGAISQSENANLPAAIAICDREGEVLGVFVTEPRDVNGDGTLETITEGNIQAAISKAATAARFQSEGEAFTTRTAFFIVQGHYPPNIDNTAGGPLFGVQDSSLGSSDAVSIAYDQFGNTTGAGVSGEYGGVPLYKNGAPIGGIGVDTADTLILDPSLALTLASGVQNEEDEAIARAGARFFETPHPIRATNVFVDGIQFPFYGFSFPKAIGDIAPTVSAIPPSVGAVDPRFFFRVSPLQPETSNGVKYGLRPDARYVGRVVARSAANFNGTFTNVDRPGAVTFSSADLTFKTVPITPVTQASFGSVSGDLRFPIIDGVEPPPAEGGLTQADVNQIIDQAVTNARISVAGIRLPRGSNVIVHVAVTDRRGNILGVFRMGDGTLFSFDVAVQKARTCAFFSTDGTEGLPAVQLSARGIGFMAQPFFPPGISSEVGPLGRLRDLVNRGKIPVEPRPSLTTITPPPRAPSGGVFDENVLIPDFQRFNDYAGLAPSELGAIRGIIGATGGINLFQDRADTTPQFVSPGLQSGMQTFPGGVPLYKNGRLVGAIGVSGDGVDEDDSAAFAGSQGFNGPLGTRSDEVPQSTILAVLQGKVNVLVQAVASHPDTRIRNVYLPVITTEQAAINDRLSRGLQDVRIPFIKLPRNPGDR